MKQGNRNAAIVAKELIRFPDSLPEQARIVGILDEAIEGIAIANANADKNMGHSRLLFVGLLNNVLSQAKESWKRITFGDVVTRSRGGINIKSTDYCIDGIPVLTIRRCETV